MVRVIEEFHAAGICGNSFVAGKDVLGAGAVGALIQLVDVVGDASPRYFSDPYPVAVVLVAGGVHRQRHVVVVVGNGPRTVAGHVAIGIIAEYPAVAGGAHRMGAGGGVGFAGQVGRQLGIQIIGDTGDGNRGRPSHIHI